MKHLHFIITFLLIVMVAPFKAQAFVDFTPSLKVRELTITGFVDYPPLGYQTLTETSDNRKTIYYSTIFKNFMNDFSVQHKWNQINIFKNTYDHLVRDVRSGNIDVLLGMYHATKKYDGIDYVMPAILDNPVVLIMLPQRVSEVKNRQTLKSMKGAVFADDKFSDFVQSQLNSMNIQVFEDDLSLFKQLYNKKIDYIISSYYLGVIKTANLGLRDKLSFSKKPLWNMPLFIGVSKAAPHHDALLQQLTEFIENPKNIQKLKNELKQEVQFYNQKSQQIVPPNLTY